MEQAIYFDDLEPETQQKIRDRFNIIPESQFWDLFPLVIIRNGAQNEGE